MSDEGAAAVDVDSGGGGSVPEPSHDSTRTTTAAIDPPEPGDEDKAPGHPDGDPINHHLRAQGKPDRQKHVDKVKARLYGGEEAEYSTEELLEHLNSDGRAFKIGGEEKHLKWNEIQRMVELGHGAFDKMREAANIRKEWSEAIERATSSPDEVSWFLQEKLNMDPRQWANDLLYEDFKFNSEMKDLMQSNPQLAQQKMQERIAQRTEREAALKEQRAQAEREAQESAKAREEFAKAVPGHLEAHGVPHNTATEQMFYAIGNKWAQVGQVLPPETVAGMVADEWKSMVWGHVSKLDDDALLDSMGKDLRKRLRALETKALKGGQKKAEDKPRPESKPREKKDAGVYTMREFLRKFD